MPARTSAMIAMRKTEAVISLATWFTVDQYFAIEPVRVDYFVGLDSDDRHLE